MIEAKLDSEKFIAMINDLSRTSGRDFNDVLKVQARNVLRTCMNWTKASSAAKLKARAEFIRRNAENKVYDGKNIVVNWQNKPGAPRMFLDTSSWNSKNNKGNQPKVYGGQSWHQVAGGMYARRWSAARWGKYLSMDTNKHALAEAKATRLLAARGAAKKSWVDAADDLALDISPPSYVRASVSTGKGSHGSGREVTDGKKFYIELKNWHGTVVNPRSGQSGQSILQRAIKARVTSFYKDLDNGVFADFKKRESRYPGLFVKRT